MASRVPLLPRRTTFARSTSSKRSEGQVLATNVDHAIITVSLAVELDLGRIERFLALAHPPRTGPHRSPRGRAGRVDGPEAGGRQSAPLR
ncbi:hypothetical protein RGF97_05355 [Streptomyces roseicoloratus]|uniref:Uncharacterized protein n=1 Tax=Streptomyces roseicoloratus TaxID=2508722 RepID=A0ABY9RQD2_9ACTN|nr:hypothetical protein [Streptomyces roseicoloratus]WMX44396.1 hypothetical protein RGF97_05355 [Streptomyces roseicoloratus]